MTSLYILMLALCAVNAHGPAQLPKNLRELGGEAYLPGTPHYREWRAVCKQSPDDCEGANLLIGARLLKYNWRVCGSGWAVAIGRYRGLGCRARKQEVRIALTARQWSSDHTRLAAWELGTL